MAIGSDSTRHVSLDKTETLCYIILMDGKIYFWDLKQLAEFLEHFVGNTAKFEVKQDGSNRWVLVFTGGF